MAIAARQESFSMAVVPTRPRIETTRRKEGAGFIVAK
jgi:hypothetical protein